MILVADGLHEDEHQIQNERHQAGKTQLRRCVGRPRRTGGKFRQDQRQGGQCSQHGECSTTSLGTKPDDAVPNAAGEQADADDPVADDHHRRKHGIPRQALRLLAPREHHRHDQRNLDHRDGERQHQRTQRFAHVVGNDLGVIDGDQNGGDQSQGDQQQVKRTGTCPQAGEQQTAGRQGQDDGDGREVEQSGQAHWVSLHKNLKGMRSLGNKELMYRRCAAGKFDTNTGISFRRTRIREMRFLMISATTERAKPQSDFATKIGVDRDVNGR